MQRDRRQYSYLSVRGLQNAWATISGWWAGFGRPLHQPLMLIGAVTVAILVASYGIASDSATPIASNGDSIGVDNSDNGTGNSTHTGTPASYALFNAALQNGEAYRDTLPHTDLNADQSLNINLSATIQAPLNTPK